MFASVETVKMAEENSDFVMGFIAQERLSDNPDLLHFTPGSFLLVPLAIFFNLHFLLASTSALWQEKKIPCRCASSFQPSVLPITKSFSSCRCQDLGKHRPV